MKRAVVVGGTGFIGMNLVDELLARGVEVTVTRRPRGLTAFLGGRAVRLVDASLDAPATLAPAFEGADAVFLAAGHYPRYSCDREATLALGVQQVEAACEAAVRAGVPRLVYTSSIATLGPAPAGRPADERDALAEPPPDSVYRAVKHAMERTVDRWAARGLHAVTLLPGGCIGPWDVRLGTGWFLVGAVRGAIPWIVDGLVHLVDVGDVARAHVEAAARAPAGSRYALAGHGLRVTELLDRVVRRYGGRRPALELDGDAARARADAEERAAASDRRRVPVPREMVDIVTSGQPVSSDRARRELGFEPRPLEESLDRAHAWFVRFGYLDPPERRPPDRSTHA